MDLTPEQCYERALKLLDKGRPDKAIKLLQIATLRAPGEPRYQSVLVKARQMKDSPSSPRASALEETAAEVLYEQAMARKEADDTAGAVRLLQLAIAKEPGEVRYREAMSALRPPPAPPKPRPQKKDATEERMRRALEASAPDDAPAPAPRSVPVGLLAGLALAVLVAVAAWYLRQPDTADTAPYLSQLPVTAAITPAPSELILRIDGSQWTPLSQEERESRLRGVMAEASTRGIQAVFVKDEQDRLLGSARGGQLYLSP